MSPVTVYPTGDVALGWDFPAAEHAAAVSDGTDASWISTLSPAVDKLELPPLPGFYSAVSAVVFRARISSADAAAGVRLLLWNGAALVTGPTWTAPAAAADFSWTPAVPGGGSWTPAKFAALELWIEAVSVGFAEAVVFAASALVTATAELEVERRKVVVPSRRLPLEVPGLRGAVVLPAGARGRVTASGAREAVVVPRRRVAVAAGPATD